MRELEAYNHGDSNESSILEDADGERGDEDDGLDDLDQEALEELEEACVVSMK